jgi:putative ABC transport system ATP-binding protein
VSEISVEITGLKKSFGSLDVLKGIDVTVNRGDVVCIIGPSGSGKSTLLHCLSGILAPDAGRITFDGRDLGTLGDRERSALRRGAFGFVFQFGQLVPELPAIENIALPLMLAGQRRRSALAAATPWLERLGLGEELGERLPGELSGGQGQRVALARALVAAPAVVFADEPTGALDSVAADEVIELLVDAAREQGTTVVLVTHEARVAAHADRTVLVRDGVDALRAAADAAAARADIVVP